MILTEFNLINEVKGTILLLSVKQQYFSLQQNNINFKKGTYDKYWILSDFLGIIYCSLIYTVLPATLLVPVL